MMGMQSLGGGISPEAVHVIVKNDRQGFHDPDEVDAAACVARVSVPRAALQATVDAGKGHRN